MSTSVASEHREVRKTDWPEWLCAVEERWTDETMSSHLTATTKHQVMYILPDTHVSLRPTQTDTHRHTHRHTDRHRDILTDTQRPRQTHRDIFKVTQLRQVKAVCDWVWLYTTTQSDTCVVPRTQSQIGDRSFSVAGPRLWNNLPTEIRRRGTTFKHNRRLLKVILFV